MRTPLLLLLSSLPAAAQTGVLIGTVTQRPDGGPAVDVVVTARGPAVEGVRTAVTDGAGATTACLGAGEDFQRFREVHLPGPGPAQLRPFRSLLPLVPRGGGAMAGGAPSAPGADVTLPAEDAAVENGYVVDGQMSRAQWLDRGAPMGIHPEVHPGLRHVIRALRLAGVSERPAGYVVQARDWTWEVRPQHVE